MAIQIPVSELQFTFVRSSGPGGQNVNKVNSKAQLRWNVMASVALTEPQRQRFVAAFGSRITLDGDVLIQSDLTRDQGKNQKDCLEKLKQMLRQIEFPPKVRKKTKPTFSAKVKRVDSKKKHGSKKADRRKPRI